MKRYDTWPAIKAVARRLECTIETVQWYVQQGKLSTHTRRGATVYRPADVELIARERTAQTIRTHAPLAGDIIARMMK